MANIMYIASNAGNNRYWPVEIKIQVIYNSNYEFTRETWIDCSDFDYDYYTKKGNENNE